MKGAPKMKKTTSENGKKKVKKVEDYLDRELVKRFDIGEDPRITKDLVRVASDSTVNEARFLVKDYYAVQKNRKQVGSQILEQGKAKRPHGMLDWHYLKLRNQEYQIKKALDAYGDAHLLGRWLKSILGIGPVISAGLLAHIDFDRAKTAAAIWRFGGYDPTVEWKKGEKRPWNADLKVLFFHCGTSFEKVYKKIKDVYGKYYIQSKEVYTERNEAGDYKERSKEILASGKRFDKTKVAYQCYNKGMFPPDHIRAMARRYAVKIFTSHFHFVGYWLHHHKLPPVPYVIEHMGHIHEIKAPNLEMIPELLEEMEKNGRD